MEEEHQEESSKAPLMKRMGVEFKKKKYVRFLLPHQDDSKTKASSPQDTNEAMFKSGCNSYQKYEGSTSQDSAYGGTQTEAISHMSSCEKLTLDLSKFTVNPHSIHPPLLHEIGKKQSALELENQKCVSKEENRNLRDNEKQHH